MASLKVLLTTLLLAIGISGANAQEQSIYSHNKSNVFVKVEGAEMTITYLSPSSGLMRANVKENTILFSGGLNKKNGWVEGTAYIFTARCGSAAYRVVGPFDYYHGTLTLQGPSPVIDPATCRVTGYTMTSSNARLRFTRMPLSE